MIEICWSAGFGDERHFSPFSGRNQNYGEGDKPAPKKWGPLPDECHATCDRTYLTSFNVMENKYGYTKQNKPNCPEFMDFVQYDDFYLGTNWRMMCEEKVKQGNSQNLYHAGH